MKLINTEKSSTKIIVLIMLIAILIFTLLCVFTPDNLDGAERLCPYPTYEEFLSANKDKSHLIWYMNCRMDETVPLNVINEYLDSLGKEYAVYIKGYKETEEMLPILLSDIEADGQVDIISTAVVDIYREGFTSAYHHYSYEGYFLPISDYLENTETGRNLYNLMPNGYWQSLDVNGEIYGLTSHGVKGYGFGYAVNKKLADKYGYDPHKSIYEQINIIEKVQEDMRDELRQGESYTACTLWADLAYPEYQPNPVCCLFGAYYDEDSDSIKRITEDEEWLEQVRLVNTLSQQVGIGIQSDNPQRLESFVTITTCEGYSIPEWGSVGTYGRETPEAYLFFEDAGYTSVLTATGIYSGSKNADMAFDFLATAKSDEYLNRLISFGEIPPNEDGTMPIEALGYRALNFPNKLIACPMVYEGAGYREWYRDALSGELPKYWGFAFDIRPVIEEHKAIIPRFFGFSFRQDVSYDELIARLDERLTEAGIDRIIEEANRQYNEWKNNN